MTRDRECIGFENGWYIFSMGDSLKIVDLEDNALMVKLDSDGEAYVDYFRYGHLWGIYDRPDLLEIIRVVYADNMREFSPHAAAAQTRLDSGKAFTPGYRVMVAVSPQSRRMVVKCGRDGITQVDEDWHNHTQEIELDRQSFMDKTRGM